MKRIVMSLCLVCLLCLSLLLSACGGNRKDAENAEEIIVIPADLSTPTPAPTATQTPIVVPTVVPAPSGTPTPTVAPAPTAAPTATPSPLPEITKSPTDETVKEGGSCLFIAKYRNATWAVWHFVSPDGQTDMTYEAAAKNFPTLEIINGMYSNMTLKNIPAALNGWRVYCRYTNDAGSADTKTALITVIAAPSPTPAPVPTQEPAPTPVVNVWVDTADLNAAIAGSGLSFSPPLEQALPEGLSLKTYRYMSGIIEADYANAAGETLLIVRKSNTSSGLNLAGDFNSYSASWDLTLKGLTLHCLGDSINANLAYYSAGDTHYSINYNAGREGQGLTADQLNSLINCIQ